VGELHAAYTVAKSLRFNDDDSAYLNRTPAGAGNQKTWTFSTWVKRGNLTLGTDSHILSARAATNPLFLFRFTTNDALSVFARNSGGTTIANYTTTSLFRDPAAWYHVVLTWDALNSAMSLSVNGVAQPLTVSTAISNVDYAINSAIVHEIARHAFSGSEHFDGYLSDVYFIDGQALDPTSFAETDAVTGSWKAKAYSGTYGTNGFHLDFTDSSTLGNGASISGTISALINSASAIISSLTATELVATNATSNLVVSNSFTLANLSGILKATAGAVATALVNLASDVTGILPVTNGGTGWAAIASAARPSTVRGGTGGQPVQRGNAVSSTPAKVAAK
jgi:hypothetical protein